VNHLGEHDIDYKATKIKTVVNVDLKEGKRLAIKSDVNEKKDKGKVE